MLDVFYATNIHGGTIVLDEPETGHCIRTLRHREGDLIAVVNGAGDYYEAVIAEIGKKSCTAGIQKHIAAYKKRSYRVHIAISPTKNSDRFEWFLEKATEIGVDEITPLLCGRTERPAVKMERARTIIATAMKQSHQAYLPLLREPIAFERFIQNQGGEKNNGIQRFIPHCLEGEKQSLASKYTAGMDVLILVGPAGDFTEKEIGLALAAGFVPVSLGENRLRTETAGVLVCSWIAAMNDGQRIIDK
jgi:16S rRNA (uracil1498-N3)-methyltransferase